MGGSTVDIMADDGRHTQEFSIEIPDKDADTIHSGEYHLPSCLTSFRRAREFMARDYTSFLCIPDNRPIDDEVELDTDHPFSQPQSTRPSSTSSRNPTRTRGSPSPIRRESNPTCLSVAGIRLEREQCIIQYPWKTVKQRRAANN